MTRYRIHKGPSQNFLRKQDRLSGISVMRLKGSPRDLYLTLKMKSVPLAVQGFHRVRRNFHGGLDAVITLTISNTLSPEGSYWIRSNHDLIIAGLLDKWRISSRIMVIRRLNVLIRIWHLIVVVGLSPILIYWYFWKWLKS